MSVTPRHAAQVSQRPRPITQFDHCLLPGSHRRHAQAIANTGRQMLIDAGGEVITALVYAQPAPEVRLWRDRVPEAQVRLDAPPSAPCLLSDQGGTPTVWLSVGGIIHYWRPPEARPVARPGVRGHLLDAATAPDGSTWLALSLGGMLRLASIDGDRTEVFDLACHAAQASIDFDARHRLHLAAVVQNGINYYRFDTPGERMEPAVELRPAEPYGQDPVLMADGGDRVVIAWRGESCRRPGDKRWSVAWQRLGRGGYIAAVVFDGGTWRRHMLADSQQVVLHHRPVGEAYGGGPHDGLRVRIEEFSPPALVRGPDGVIQVCWANLDRRWVYASRDLGSSFSPAIEVRGPLEALTGPCLLPRHAAWECSEIPIGLVTRDRTYVDRLALPAAEVRNGRTIDFVQLDEVAGLEGLEQVVSRMRRHPANPVIPKGEYGSFDDAGVVADIRRRGEGWWADYAARSRQSTSLEFASVGRARSDDGIRWQKLPPQPLADRYVVDGCADHRYTLRYLEDPTEPDASRRYKGLWRVEDRGPWAWAVVVSPDAARWHRVRTEKVIRADDDLRLWVDEHDVPQRRWKAMAIGRSHCGRVCAMWWSADGVNWQGHRDTLDLDDPFGAPAEPAGTGHIVLDAWAGPGDEDELHGGYAFRDGDRWLCHYMKWTADGHIACALASSRDGLHFSRVGGGATTLPLGEPGTWDAGRVAVREAPFRVGDMWWQYYTGCGWKHGLAGQGAKTSPFGIDAPNQMGLAQIEAGRWVHLRLCRDRDDAVVRTTPLRLCRPHRLALDLAGMAAAGSSVTGSLLDPSTGQPVPGFGHRDCLPVTADGALVPICWRDAPRLPAPARLCVELRITGWGLRLYAMKLLPAEP